MIVKLFYPLLVRGDRFWVGLQYNFENDKLEWYDGTSAMEEPWVKQDNSGNVSSLMAATMHCFVYNGAVSRKVFIYCLSKMYYSSHSMEYET